MKKIIFGLVLGLLAFVLTRFAFAQNATSSGGSNPNLTFPIVELGNCSSISDCKNYCDDPSHTASCIAYAKQKGFYKPSNLDSQKDTVLADAKSTLGCDSIESCKAFCSDSANADLCSSFAKKHNLKGGNSQVSDNTLQEAKTTLGCDSINSCQTFCQQEENKAKCESFARQNGINGGNTTNGPGGCSSQASCRTYCADPNNFQTCSKYQTNAGKSFTGPGGCSSQDSCRKFCESNPSSCNVINVSPTISSFPSNTISPTFQLPHDKLPNSSNPSYPNYQGVVPTVGSPGGFNQNVVPSQPQQNTSVRGASTEQNFFQWFLNGFLRL